jgi:hypothetical protein
MTVDDLLVEARSVLPHRLGRPRLTAAAMAAARRLAMAGLVSSRHMIHVIRRPASLGRETIPTAPGRASRLAGDPIPQQAPRLDHRTTPSGEERSFLFGCDVIVPVPGVAERAAPAGGRGRKSYR